MQKTDRKEKREGVNFPFSFSPTYKYSNANKNNMSLKLNNSDQYEVIKILLNEIDHPKAFSNKVKCLMSSGLSEKEAKDFVSTTETELEIYYEIGIGLMFNV